MKKNIIYTILERRFCGFGGYYVYIYIYKNIYITHIAIIRDIIRDIEWD